MGVLIFGGGGSGGGSGPDLSADTIQDRYVLNPYTFHDSEGRPGTGTIFNWDGSILAGGSGESNPIIIAPSAERRHIAAGSYLNREIELQPMPAGSTALSQSGNTVTLTKQAGYIPAGTENLTIGAGSASLSRSGATVTLTKQAGYIPAGTENLTVPLQSRSVTITSNGTTTYYPTSSSYAGLSQLTVTTNVSSASPALQDRSVTITSNGTNTYYATSSYYYGLNSLTVTTAVQAEPRISYTTRRTTSGQTFTISPGGEPYAVSMIASSAVGSNNNIVALQMASNGQGRLITAGGTMGNTPSASFGASSVTIYTNSSTYTFDTSINYTVCVVYV